jgi:hypothetical protein
VPRAAHTGESARRGNAPGSPSRWSTPLCSTVTASLKVSPEAGAANAALPLRHRDRRLGRLRPVWATAALMFHIVVMMMIMRMRMRIWRRRGILVRGRMRGVRR